jgi:microcystin-dependent protein
MILSNTTGTTPDGYLLCNGAEVSREQYPILFGATGTYYGAGNGTTTFNVPDLVDSCQHNITYIIKT